ncbi:MAG: NAD-binding protein [Gammaproteobacteria bacterium]
MPNATYLLLRRMRAPLIVLICVYAVSVLGFVLIPGQDNQGRPWHMDFFHAFYFVSFMGSTIGLGEIPYPFTDAQRLWATATIYTSVVAWLYAIGALLTNIQDSGFRAVVSRASFVRAVRRLRDPFYLVCGYGDTGSLLVRELAGRNVAAVVIDIDPQRIPVLETAGLPLLVPGLCADAADAAALLDAGLRHRYCHGVVAVTNDEHANLTVAITAKLLNPQLPVTCRAERQDTEANMASFGTDHIVNPFDTFADRFALMFHSPSMHLIYDWLTSEQHAPLKEFVKPPRGHWILCGFGRFGKAVQRRLNFEGVRTTVVEADPVGTDPPADAVIGRGTEAVTLRQAKVQQAAGIIAGTDDDANNLSILVTARDMNPELFTVGRQNHWEHSTLFQTAAVDIVMQPAAIIVRRVLSLLMTPMLAEFLRLARHQDEGWANLLVSRMSGIALERPPDTWAIQMTAEDAPAVMEMLASGSAVTVAQLCADPRRREDTLPCIALLLVRHGQEMLLPDSTTAVGVDDRLLFCGRPQAQRLMSWNIRNYNRLNYVRTGTERPSGLIWQWLAGHRRH